MKFDERNVCTLFMFNKFNVLRCTIYLAKVRQSTNFDYTNQSISPRFTSIGSLSVCNVCVCGLWHMKNAWHFYYSHIKNSNTVNAKHTYESMSMVTPVALYISHEQRMHLSQQQTAESITLLFFYLHFHFFVNIFFSILSIASSFDHLFCS